MSSSIKDSEYSKSRSRFNENRWVSQVRQTLEEELVDENEATVSIFNVPKILMASDPDSYTPQEVAIGPYHYLRPELYEMERYKLAAAKWVQKSLLSHKFQDVVQQLTDHDLRIRACYHKYLDLSGETLAWMMAIDASFLLEFLQLYAIKQGKAITLMRLSSRMSHLLDNAGQKSAHNAILRDLIMLENQIPLFVLRKILEFQFATLNEADDVLSSMLLGFCQELSPFKMMEDNKFPKILVSDCAHLLDYLYAIMTPEFDLGCEEIIEVADEENGEGDENFSSSFGSSSHVKELFNVLSNLLTGPVTNFLKKVLFSKPIKMFLQLPWMILSKLPGLQLLKAPMEMLSSRNKEDDAKPEDENPSSNNVNKPPLIEEITIPSVRELIESGVIFSRTNGNISTIAFDSKTFTLYLPAISLDVNTEAILRNLVAYEAAHASGPLSFTRYTEMMNGIIDTAEDARLLREKGILLNHLKSDKEAANLWNGMSKSLRLTRVPFLDKVIEDVNKYHDARLKVRFEKFMKRYVFGSWQILTFLAAILMLLFTALQAFCSAYSCHKIFHQVISNTKF